MKQKFHFKKIIFIIIILFSFFFELPSLKAADKIESYSPNCNSSDALYKITYRLKGIDEDRRVGCVGLITINTTKQGYCIEPGVKVGEGYTVASKEFSAYSTAFFNNASTSSDKRQKVSQILTFAIDLSKKGVKNATKAEIYKAYAAQVLIWEVVTGERTSFEANDPSSSNKDFYSIINSSTYASNSAITAIKNEYNAILSKIRSTYLATLGTGKNTFSKAESKANVVPLTCNQTKCSLTIKDSDFSNWEIANKGGLEVSKTNDSIIISTTEPIKKDTPATIEISVSGNKGIAYAYTDSTKQDVVTIAGLKQSAYLKVYTPRYQLKIIKESKSDVFALDGLPLSGAKFNICYDNACSKKVSKQITTDSNGIATYSELEKPGTYYIKEVTAPNGYELSSSIRAVTVSPSDIAGTSNYGQIIVTNTSKIFNLTKKTIDDEGNVVILEDGCGTGDYTGPEFSIKENNKELYFNELEPGVYSFSDSETPGATTRLKTCQGEFAVHALPKCNYTITEEKLPDGMVYSERPAKNINVCGVDKNVSFTNGFAGLEFQKKNEDGELISGGEFSLQVKVNNLYKDVLLRELEPGNYVYESDLSDEDFDATYIFLTNDGISLIQKLPPGEYRIVEKKAPEGYEYIEDVNSTAKVIIKDSEKEGYYLTELVNHKTNVKGADASAELIVAITTGRKVPNYVVMISILAVLLVITIIVRKKFKK